MFCCFAVEIFGQNHFVLLSRACCNQNVWICSYQILPKSGFLKDVMQMMLKFWVPDNSP